MSCADCRNWLTKRVTDYEDGTRIVNFACLDGMGKCEILKVETPSDFHCNKWGYGHDHIEIMGRKKGAPWQNSEWGVCPDCNGVGYGCRRCAGTGRVLYYDDGYIGEEQTRRHPNESKGLEKLPPPRCLECNRDVDPNWMACPYCGTKTDRPEEPVRVTELP